MGPYWCTQCLSKILLLCFYSYVSFDTSMTVGIDYGCVAILGLKQIFILLNCPKTYRPAILIHPGQGGPLFGQDQGSAAVPASAPAATMASAWTRNHLQFRHWDKNNHVFAFTGLPFQCQIENRPKKTKRDSQRIISWKSTIIDLLKSNFILGTEEGPVNIHLCWI